MFSHFLHHAFAFDVIAISCLTYYNFDVQIPFGVYLTNLNGSHTGLWEYTHNFRRSLFVFFCCNLLTIHTSFSVVARRVDGLHNVATTLEDVDAGTCVC